MRTQIEPCHLCSKFSVSGTGAPPAHGHCEGFEVFRRYEETNAACVLWTRARNEAQRKRWAEQQEQMKGNV